MQLIILDYSLSEKFGWAKVQIFNKPVEFTFSNYDAVTACIDLNLIEQPDDRDSERAGYEKPYFSATVRELLPWGIRIEYIQNLDVLEEFANTEFAEQIIYHLALQAPEVREVIQAEANSIACCDCPASIVAPGEIRAWFMDNQFDFMWNLSPLKKYCPVNWDYVSQHKIASLRTENKLVTKLI